MNRGNHTAYETGAIIWFHFPVHTIAEAKRLKKKCLGLRV